MEVYSIHHGNKGRHFDWQITSPSGRASASRLPSSHRRNTQHYNHLSLYTPFSLKKHPTAIMMMALNSFCIIIDTGLYTQVQGEKKKKKILESVSFNKKHNATWIFIQRRSNYIDMHTLLYWYTVFKRTRFITKRTNIKEMFLLKKSIYSVSCNHCSPQYKYRGNESHFCTHCNTAGLVVLILIVSLFLILLDWHPVFLAQRYVSYKSFLIESSIPSLTRYIRLNVYIKERCMKDLKK